MKHCAQVSWAWQHSDLNTNFQALKCYTENFLNSVSNSVADDHGSPCRFLGILYTRV
jgi:hypothetical protein